MPFVSVRLSIFSGCSSAALSARKYFISSFVYLESALPPDDSSVEPKPAAFLLTVVSSSGVSASFGDFFRYLVVSVFNDFLTNDSADACFCNDRTVLVASSKTC